MIIYVIAVVLQNAWASIGWTFCLKMVVDDLYLTLLINGQDLIGDIAHTLTLVGHLFG